jgi:hypothetical protein
MADRSCRTLTGRSRKSVASSRAISTAMRNALCGPRTTTGMSLPKRLISRIRCSVAVSSLSAVRIRHRPGPPGNAAICAASSFAYVTESTRSCVSADASHARSCVSATTTYAEVGIDFDKRARFLTQGHRWHHNERAILLGLSSANGDRGTRPCPSRRIRNSTYVPVTRARAEDSLPLIAGAGAVLVLEELRRRFDTRTGAAALGASAAAHRVTES